jgi:hypothetical protein
MKIGVGISFWLALGYGDLFVVGIFFAHIAA